MSKMRLLIAQDTWANADDIRQRALRLGHEVTATVVTVEEAIAAVEARRPDGVVMDVAVGGATGAVEAAEEISARFNVPVVYTTSGPGCGALGCATVSAPFVRLSRPFEDCELNSVLKVAYCRHQLEGRLKESKQWLLTVLSGIGEGVIATDQDWRIQFMNPVAETLTGWKSDEAETRPLGDVYRVMDEQERQSGRGAVGSYPNRTDSPPRPREVVMTRRLGEKIPIEATTIPIRRLDGEVSGAIVVFRDLIDSRQMSTLLSYQVSHDSLTGLINRSEFERRLESAAMQSKTEGAHHVLCHLDIDQFRVINNTAGQRAGDALLRRLARLFEQELGEDVLAARLGGDEFAVLFTECDLERAVELADSLRAVIGRSRFEWQGQHYRVTASLGAVSVDERSPGVVGLLSMADVACNVAKELGRDRIYAYDGADPEAQIRHGEMYWVNRIVEAFDQERFVLYRQSIVPVSNRATRTRHYELLIRMLDEQGRLVAPGLFIPPAERYNLMPIIDRWVIRTAFSYLGRAAQRGEDTQSVVYGVNLSGTSLGDSSLLKYIEEQLERFRIPASSICFEITETAAVAHLDVAVELFHELKRLGFRFALDDFGSGLSSFAYLQKLPIDFLKIDGAFVREMNDNPLSLAIIEAASRIAHVIKIETIAEFVENDSIMKKLREIGVDYAQGYGVDRPQPLEDHDRRIASSDAAADGVWAVPDGPSQSLGG